MAFGQFNDVFDFLKYQSEHDPLSKAVNSLLSKFTGSGLTGAEQEANAFTSRENAISREFSANQAQLQMDFQERMANTQYQRAVADMQAAGINPALAYSQGGNVAPSGAAASASGASSVNPHSGMSMSELVALATLKPQIDMMRAQAEDYRAAADLKRSQKSRTDTETSWLPQIYASQIGLQQSTADKYAAEVESIMASAEGQRLANEWNPKLWQNTLDNGRVDRMATIVGIQKCQQEINNLIAQNANIIEDTRLKQLMQGLTAAQISLVNSQTSEVNANVWHKEFENAFEAEFGTRPNEPVWNAVVGMLGKAGRMSYDLLMAPARWLESLFGKD